MSTVIDPNEFFAIRADILALVAGLEQAEAVFLLTSVINEHLAPMGCGATVTCCCLVSTADKLKQPQRGTFIESLSRLVEELSSE